MTEVQGKASGHADAATTAVADDPSRHRRVVAAASVGTMLEFYDFAIFGTAAALVFGQLFFPSSSSVASTLAAFATFAAAFVARPIGGMIFGHFGDRLGRKRILQISLLLMGLATVVIGLLPTYDQIGLAAPVLLVTLRVVQGLAAGGEVGGAVVTVLEHAPPKRRAAMGAYVFACMSVGGILAAATFLLLSATLTDDQFTSWGWRMPFLASIVLVGVGSYMRNRIDETPEFEQVAASAETVRAPLIEVVRSHWRTVVLVVGVAGAYSTATFLLAVYLVGFLAQPDHAGRTFSLVAYFMSMVVCALAAIGAGIVADRWGRRRTMVAGLAGILVFAFPLFLLVSSGPDYTILVVMMVVGALIGVVGGPLGTYFSEIFPASVRYSGFSLGYQIASIVGGGLAPFIATALYAAGGDEVWPVATYLVVFILVGLICLRFLPDEAQVARPKPAAGAETVSTSRE